MNEPNMEMDFLIPTNQLEMMNEPTPIYEKVTVDHMIDEVFKNIFDTNINNTIEILGNYFGIDIEIDPKNEDCFILNGNQIDEFEYDEFTTKWFDHLPVSRIIGYYGSVMEDCGLRLTEDGSYEKFRTERK